MDEVVQRQLDQAFGTVARLAATEHLVYGVKFYDVHPLWVRQALPAERDADYEASYREYIDKCLVEKLALEAANQKAAIVTVPKTVEYTNRIGQRVIFLGALVIKQIEV